MFFSLEPLRQPRPYSEEQRTADTYEALLLGPLIPVWGVVEKQGSLACQCAGKARHPAGDTRDCGKHPRWPDFLNKGTSDPKMLEHWRRGFPGTNYGILAGHGIVIVDLREGHLPVLVALGRRPRVN